MAGRRRKQSFKWLKSESNSHSFDKPWCTCLSIRNRGWTCDWDFKYRNSGGYYWDESQSKWVYSSEKKWVYLWVCDQCRKPSLSFMSTCDTCGKLFKGIFPFLKFAYPCPDCE